MNRFISKLRRAMAVINGLDQRLDETNVLQGSLLSEIQLQKPAGPLNDFEFKVFSQWGEDGIIQYLTRRIPIENRTFIEFGVADFFESNCRFLLAKDNWQGYVIDGSETNIARLQASYFYWQRPLTAKAAFIDAENVAQLLDESGFDKDLGILSVDVDGVDYFLLERLVEWRARIIIVEYNALFGSERAVTIPYDASFTRSKAHSSNLYFGASLRAFERLLSGRGYALVGVNSVGSNAFFVRRDLLDAGVKQVSVQACFRESTFREGRDESGRLLNIPASAAFKHVARLPLMDTESGASLRVGDLFRAGGLTK